LRGEHWLLLDIDNNKPSVFFEIMKFLEKHGIDWYFDVVDEITPNGLHFYIFKPFKFEELVSFIPHVPYVDLNWYKIGVERGYWFLVNYKPILRNNLTFMKIKVEDDCEWLSMKRQRV
jgi:hypothetical protein